MPPHRFFEILSQLVEEQGVSVVFQRFRSDAFEAGVHLVPRGADLEAMHQDGQFGPIYLSVGGLPHHQTDWEFSTRSSGDLIHIVLGATAPGEIALSEAYRWGESAPVRQVFDELERKIAEVCHRGVRGSSGKRHRYPGHYWSEEVRPLALYRSLGNKAGRFCIDEE